MMAIEDCDFTVNKFIQLCEAISSTCPATAGAEYLGDQQLKSFVLMNSDAMKYAAGRIQGNALMTWRIEHELVIRATYYFRSIKRGFKPEMTGEPCLSAGKDPKYFSETGRTGSFEGNLSNIPDKKEQVFAETADNLIELIWRNEFNNF